MASPIRQDQASISLTVGGRQVSFIFNRREGGQVTSEESKTFPGGGRPQKAHGGPQTVENITLAGEFVPESDHEDVRYLRSVAGRARAIVSEQLLDVDGAAFGRPDTWTGVLMSVHSGDYDANSADPREIEVEISTDGVG